MRTLWLVAAVAQVVSCGPLAGSCPDAGAAAAGGVAYATRGTGGPRQIAAGAWGCDSLSTGTTLPCSGAGRGALLFTFDGPRGRAAVVPGATLRAGDGFRLTRFQPSDNSFPFAQSAGWSGDATLEVRAGGQMILTGTFCYGAGGSDAGSVAFAALQLDPE